HLLDRWREQHVGAGSRRDLDVALEVARIRRQILVRGELQRVDEQRDGREVTLVGGCTDQRRVTVVQVTHGRHETDRAAAGPVGVQLLAERGDGVDQPHEICSRSRRRSARSTIASYPGSSPASIAARWRSTVAQSPRATGPVSAAAGPSAATLSTVPRTRSRYASSGTPACSATRSTWPSRATRGWIEARRSWWPSTSRVSDPARWATAQPGEGLTAAATPATAASGTARTRRSTPTAAAATSSTRPSTPATHQPSAAARARASE